MRDERGQVLPLAVAMLTSMLAMAALVVDVGAWFQASRRMQAVVDAAALAGAQELPLDPAAAVGRALDYASRNGVVLSPSDVAVESRVRSNDAIAVRASEPASGILSRVLGIDGVTVGAGATAAAAPLAAARWAAPIGVNEQNPQLRCLPTPCFGQETTLTLADLKGATSSGAGAFGLIDFAADTGASGASELAAWLLHGYGSTLGQGSYASDPGAKFNSAAFQQALQARLGSELLLPVYRTITGSGANATFEIVSWVGFRLSGYAGSGSTGTLTGSFVPVTWEGEPGWSTLQPDFGARTVALVG